MAESRILTKFEQGRIVELQRRGPSQRATANVIDQSQTVIANFVKNLDTYVLKKSSDHPNKISPFLDKRIRREVKRDSNLIKANADDECSSRQFDDIYIGKSLRT